MLTIELVHADTTPDNEPGDLEAQLQHAPPPSFDWRHLSDLAIRHTDRFRLLRLPPAPLTPDSTDCPDDDQPDPPNPILLTLTIKEAP